MLIVGGGAFNDLGVKDANTFAADVRIAWGIGQSYRFGKPSKPLNNRKVGKIYVAATTRDPAAARPEISLLPCVSVLHPIVDIAPGGEQGLFLNEDDVASGGNVGAVLKKYEQRGFITASNALQLDEFSNLFAQTHEITTNSYHAAYWSLLSGRGVRLIGYSSKFVNLLTLFDLAEENLVRYERGNGIGLAEGVIKALTLPASYASNHDQLKKRFRAMNLDFATSLKRFGVNAHSIASGIART